MFKNRLLKVLAMLMVLNILIIPLTSFLPQEQNKYTVHASGELVDIRFFQAAVTMFGITAVGITAMMSQQFVIPEVDMIDLKNKFQATLDADATKKSAWMKAQTEYLANGVAKTMSAVELSKIGINDIYTDFMSYLKTNVVTTDSTGLTVGNYTMSKSIINQTYYAGLLVNNKFTYYPSYGCFYADASWGSYVSSTKFLSISFMDNSTGTPIIFDFYREGGEAKVLVSNLAAASTYSIDARKFIYSSMLVYGLNMSQFSTSWLTGVSLISGTVTNTNNIINATDTTRSIVPTIPWIGTDIPVGTVVTPAISAPYAGAVPIDVPITVPIDPPIDDPIDPPAEPTLIGTVAAILAALVPISGLLDNIDVGIDGLAGTISDGIDSVIDGIGDVVGSLTGGITSSLTDIQSSISTLFDPPTETLNLDKLKNLNSVLFTKFPFSIPFDFMRMIGSFSGDPVAPVLKIPFDMSSFGGENTNLEFDLSQFDYIASIVRQISFIGFVFFMLFNTRKLIWK